MLHVEVSTSNIAHSQDWMIAAPHRVYATRVNAQSPAQKPSGIYWTDEVLPVVSNVFISGQWCPDMKHTNKEEQQQQFDGRFMTGCMIVIVGGKVENSLGARYWCADAQHIYRLLHIAEAGNWQGLI